MCNTCADERKVCASLTDMYRERAFHVIDAPNPLHANLQGSWFEVDTALAQEVQAQQVMFDCAFDPAQAVDWSKYPTPRHAGLAQASLWGSHGKFERVTDNRDLASYKYLVRVGRHIDGFYVMLLERVF